ncbi:uncharacterized protein LOC122031813 [Zingiber officinale]|uniref:UBZ4-type domain-containing protein n=1 Tax=Zingiber officinale TaxID=94328 RepID=A0A8J5BDN2_ZINOF|nr:uncharacterized protein LOC122031813 [Zingiber officinale]KAG6469856.1 hypothetical protein ZIOFF_070789 [Zingiber officinale]
MVSTETPPGPSCSSDLASVKSHEKAPENIAFLEEDPTPKFSIRNYVLATRCKCVEASWPFSRQFLQLCMKHGVKDLLPPFEPPELVRSLCSRKAEQLVASTTEDKPALLLKEFISISNSSDLVIESTLKSVNPPPNEGTYLDELIHTEIPRSNCHSEHNHSAEPICSVANGTEASLNLASIEPRKNFEKPQKPLVKKCKLKGKLGVICELNKEGDILTNSSMVSDAMASKVCPVCKAFSSSSNTTLNAHIDRCLSMDSNMKDILSEVPKFKAKQRKKRLMAEIYMAAPHATLEDLDRRNGSNWAVELALPTTLTSGVVNETKRSKMSPVNECIENGNDIAVYVDSNGMKLGILSKFNKPALNDLNLRKKKDLSLKHLKDMKVKTQKRKLSFELPKNQFVDALDDDDQSAIHQQDHVQSSALHAEEQVGSTAPATSKPWMCSIESDILKDHPKGRNMDIDNTTPVHRSILAGNHRCNSLGVSNKFPRSSEVFTDSPKMKRVDCLYSDNHPANDVKEKSLEPTSSSRWSSRSACSTIGLLRLSKPTDKFLSSEKKSVEIDMGIRKRSIKCSNKPMGSLQDSSSFKDQAIFSSKREFLVKRPYFHLEGSKSEASEKTLKTLKFRKHRSALRTCKRVLPYLLPIDGVHGTTNSLIARKDRAAHTHGSGRLNANTITHGCEGPELSETIEELEHNNLTQCDNSQVEHSDIQAEDQSHGATGEAGGAHVTNDFINSDKLEISFRAKSCSSPCADGKVQEENSEQRSGQQEFVFNDEDHDDVEYGDIQMEIEAVDKEVEVSCEVLPEEYQAETISAQDSIGCLTSRRGMELDRKCMPQDTGKSGSPISTGSSVSLPPSGGSRMKDPEPEKLMSGIPVQDNLSFASQAAEFTEITEERNSTSRAHKKDDLPFCCLCRKSILKDSQLPSHSETSRSTKENQILNLSIGPRISSSLRTYQNPRSNNISNSTQQSNYNNPIDFCGSYGPYTDLGSPSLHSPNQSSSIPVLRLMGKNLMVVNNEQLLHPQTIASNHIPYVNSVSTRFASINNLMKHDSSYCCHQQPLTGDRSMPQKLPTLAMCNTTRVPPHSTWTMKPDQLMQQTPYKRHGARTPYVTNDVIVIDDCYSQHQNELIVSLKNTANTSLLGRYWSSNLAPRPFTCFPSESQNRNVSGRPRALFANFQPVNDASFINQRFNTQSQGVLIPCPTFQPPATSRMGPSLYYPLILR